MPCKPTVPGRKPADDEHFSPRLMALFRLKAGFFELACTQAYTQESFVLQNVSTTDVKVLNLTHRQHPLHPFTDFPF